MATTVEAASVSRRINLGIDRQAGWLDPLAERVQAGLTGLVERTGAPGRKLKDLLNGTKFGHPVHPMLVVGPLGGWLTGALLDLAGERRAADRAIAFGVVAAVPTALAGLADWHDQDGPARRTGLVHALCNSAALACFVGSLAARGRGSRGLGIGLSTTGLALASAGGYLGGELSYKLGVQVDRNAWLPPAGEFLPAARSSEVREGQLAAGEITVEGQRLALVLTRRGGRVLAMGAACSHLGGPLAEGALVEGGCVECPWHGSRFDLESGRVVQGPAVFPQPVYEARERDGQIEVRRRPEDARPA